MFVTITFFYLLAHKSVILLTILICYHAKNVVDLVTVRKNVKIKLCVYCALRIMNIHLVTHRKKIESALIVYITTTFLIPPMIQIILSMTS